MLSSPRRPDTTIRTDSFSHFKDLGCPTPSNRGIDSKGEFSPLPNLKHAQKKARRVVTGEPMTIPC